MPTISKVETITPEKARRWLKNNPNNRKPSDGRIGDLVLAMERGEWNPEIAPILFNGEGALLDGQNRLHAIILYGQPIKNRVTRGMDRVSIYSVDTGGARTLAHALSMQKEANATSLASAIRWAVLARRSKNGALMELRSRRSGSRAAVRAGKWDTLDVRLTIPQGLEALEQEPKMRQHVAAVRSWNQRGGYAGFPVGVAGGLLAVLSQIDPDKARSFVRQIMEGGGGGGGKAPTAKLRNRIIAARKNRVRLAPSYLLALTVKAWNAFYEGIEQIDRLAWSTAESFPRVAGWEKIKT